MQNNPMIQQQNLLYKSKVFCWKTCSFGFDVKLMDIRYTANVILNMYSFFSANFAASGNISEHTAYLISTHPYRCTVVILDILCLHAGRILSRMGHVRLGTSQRIGSHQHACNLSFYETVLLVYLVREMLDFGSMIRHSFCPWFSDGVVLVHGI
jgi:hypothetical protein